MTNEISRPFARSKQGGLAATARVMFPMINAMSAAGRGVVTIKWNRLMRVVRHTLWSAVCGQRVGRLVARFTRDSIRNHGLVFDTSDENYGPEVKAMMFWRLYERNEIRLVRRYIRPSDDVIELGSSLGVVASHIVTRLDRNARYLGVEANSRLSRPLCLNLERHARCRSWEIVHAAISYPAKDRVLFEVSRFTANSKLATVTSTDILEVSGETLSNLLQRYGMETYSLVADIEGAEAGFIYGGETELAGCIRLIIELHDTVHAGKPVSIEMMAGHLVLVHGFKVLEQRGHVFAFGR